MRIIALATALSASVLLFPVAAGAVPLDQGAHANSSSEIILVREGCGPGHQWSERLRMCVRDSTRARVHDAVREIRRERVKRAVRKEIIKRAVRQRVREKILTGH